MGQTPRPADTGISIGQIFLGKYRVEQILGQGGMGIVARCTHLALNEQVAVKMLRNDVLQDADAKERFMREAQAAVKLRSEYVARVSDVGTFENGVPYMVMEYLDGQDLGQLLDEQQTVPVQWATEMILQAAEALAEAHSISIVHRDVKPTNLFVTWRPDGTSIIKVLDFGISKSPMGTDMQLTQTQSLLGTPAYMSPEQMRSARLVDARSDIWSLGSVMYELLEGRRPFEADSFSEMCVKVAVDAPAPMRNAGPDLEHVVLRCLAKSPEQRYSSMAELGRDLVPFARDQHGANVLVERMHRMLGRNTPVSWDGSTTNGGRAATPLPIRDAKSAPVRANSPAAWHGGSDPSGARFTPVPFPLTSREPSAPALAPSEYQIKRGSKLPIVIALTLIVLGGAAIAAFSTVRGNQQAKVPAAAQQATTDPTATQMPALPTEPVGSAGSGTGPTTPERTPEQSAADKLAADQAAANQAAADRAALADKTATKGTGTGTGKRNGGKRGSGKVGRDPKVTATTTTTKGPVVEKVKPPDVPKQPADPFSSPRPTPRQPN
ncbi:MAG: protein kinase [Deltaproteobacteria bacterium]|nr:protein kinase [Deltaproteobacteria bacterium]